MERCGLGSGGRRAARYGSSAYCFHEDDEDEDDEDKEVAAETHAIRYYGGEPAVNRPGLSCAGTFEAHGIDWERIDWEAMLDKVQKSAARDQVTEAEVQAFAPDVLDPTQRLIYEYVQDKWFPDVVLAYVTGRALPRPGGGGRCGVRPWRGLATALEG